jgi:predicted O-methyltransferase YrrM
MRPEVDGLVDMCNFISQKNTVKQALEVGSYIGQSTVTFANNFKNLECLYAVDPFSLQFNSDNLFDTNNIETIKATFIENIKPYTTIKHIQENSKTACELFDDETFDFIYIDGCHEFSCVLEDAKLWKPKVKKGGHISFHDIDWTDVQKALSVYFNLNEGYITRDNSITFRII